jgi:hypothetical protein
MMRFGAVTNNSSVYRPIWAKIHPILIVFGGASEMYAGMRKLLFYV